MRSSEKEKLIRKVLKVVNIGNDLSEAAIYRTALFQTHDIKMGLDLLIKNQINECPAELYNIASVGSTKKIVSETIKAIERYAPRDRFIIIFINNKNFIPEFVKQKFSKRLKFGMVKGLGHLKIINTTNL